MYDIVAESGNNTRTDTQCLIMKYTEYNEHVEALNVSNPAAIAKTEYHFYESTLTLKESHSMKVWKSMINLVEVAGGWFTQQLPLHHGNTLAPPTRTSRV